MSLSAPYYPTLLACVLPLIWVSYPNKTTSETYF
jgi:hypothetical protein